MSGGSMNYLYVHVGEVADRLALSTSPVRRAFGEHLALVAKALHDVEWVDSADYGPGDENAAIRRVVSQAQELGAATRAAEDALRNLTEAIEAAKAVKP